MRVGAVQAAHDRRALPRRDQPRSRGRGRARRFPPGPLLPAQRHLAGDPAAARARCEEIEPLARSFLADTPRMSRGGRCRSSSPAALRAAARVRAGRGTSASCATRSSARCLLCGDGRFDHARAPAAREDARPRTISMATRAKEVPRRDGAASRCPCSTRRAAATTSASSKPVRCQRQPDPRREAPGHVPPHVLRPPQGVQHPAPARQRES